MSELRLKLIEIKNEFTLGKGIYNDFSNFYYRTLPQIQEKLKPLEKKHQVLFNITSELVELGGRVFVKGMATVESLDGLEKITSYSSAELPAVAPKGMSLPQSSGTSETYALKRALGNLLGIDDSVDADSISDTPAKVPTTVEDTTPAKPKGDNNQLTIMNLRGEIIRTQASDLNVDKLNEWYNALNKIGYEDQTKNMIDLKAKIVSATFNKETNSYQ